MLRQVYDSSLKDIPVASLSHTTENAEKTTLGTIASQCKHIIFYIFRSEPTDLLIRLRNMVERKNSSSDTTSTSSSPAKLKKLFGLKKAKKKNSASSLRDISVVLIDLEGTPERTYDEALISDEFYTILPLQYTAKSQLVRALGFTSSPAVTIVRSDDMEIITKQGRRCLMEDEAGKLFPWNDPPAESVFSGSFLQWTPETKQTTSRQFSTLTPCVKGLYFGAKWCPPCRAMTQQLTEAYRKIKAKALPFEIFFCSSDRTMASFEDHFSSMPWFAFPFDNEILTTLTRAYNVNGIPTFLIIDEKGEVITRHGRSVLLADPNGDMFPWKKQPLYELTEYTLHRVADNRSLILFTEGTPEDNEFAKQVLQPCIQWMTSFDGDKSSPASPEDVQVFFTGEDPLCDHVLEILGLGEAELPLLVVCDALVGHFAVCDKPDVSDVIVVDFLKSYLAGELEVRQMPSAQNTRRVGGVPFSLIEQMISAQQATAAVK